MKFISSFSKFLENTVNLNPTRMDIADDSVNTMTGIIENNELFGEHFIDSKPQGSIRQRTIIKPVKEDQDFDVDLLVELKLIDAWDPADYLLNLADEFRAMDRYKDKVDTRGKNRCVTIDYESDFHIDIVPTIKTDSGYVIMNKETNQFESADGDGYAAWFAGKEQAVGGDKLAGTVRLLKYIRDSKGSFEAKSVLLTTLIGHQVLSSDVQSTQYPDLSTTFLTVITRLDGFLQTNPSMPQIDNPVLPGENFNRHWDQTKYDKFRTKIHDYAVLAREAYNEADGTKSLEKWRKIFGDKFPQLEEENSLARATATRDVGEQFLSDLEISESIAYSLKVDARVEQGGFQPFFLRGSRFPLKKKRKLTFFVTGNIPDGCSIKWKVKNYDSEAKNAGDLRGEITDDKGFRNKVENTKYTGSHYVEAYAVQGKVCIAKDQLTVPIANAI